MQFRIADTFTASLARLTGEEQKAVKTTAFDLQMDPSRPGFQLHRLDGARDPNFRSVRVSRDIRIIVHQAQDSFMLCYVDHHDDAYRWAKGRKLETHPRTGAAQLVEVRETVQEVAVPVYVPTAQQALPKPLPFAGLPDDQLLGYGVPAEWLPDVHAADEDAVLDLAVHLPSEAAEALLELATGGTPQAPVAAPAGIDPFEHPDAQRRFRVMRDVEELERALDFPWEKWAVFLHPAQRAIVERDFSGPAKVSGSAGTGKTIVALHRAVHLARANPNARVLLTTFSQPLANALRDRLRVLVTSEPQLAERVEVYAIDALAERLYRLNVGTPAFASEAQLRALIEEAAVSVEDNRFSQAFMLAEWEQVVDAWQLDTWEAYRDVPRLGRRRSLPEAQRRTLWSVFEQVRSRLHEQGLVTRSQMFAGLAATFGARRSPFDFVVVDESQDIGVAQMRFLAALGAGRPNGLFFAGDLGQRIFQQPFSWQALGVEVRGRSRTLKVNYRTSHQIRRRSDLLLGVEIADADGNAEDRSGTISVFNGPEPAIVISPSAEEESRVVASWLADLAEEGLEPHEISVFVRSGAQIDRATAAAESAGLDYVILDDSVQVTAGRLSIGTMHLAKGLEFRAVVVMACDDEVIPLQERIESVTDDSDLEDIYNTERHLLYVACTRARDHLLVIGVEPASEFLDDLRV
ncbi:MAG: UvrD-helicase domain-containing protein [Chloroflexota bacterium]|nr:UvrD-helicase domain-containing protein [Chloroflexota bacterium]MDE2886069.1 UvrD-helicase domain-containing protein [Chloroflexota bacterium]